MSILRLISRILSKFRTALKSDNTHFIRVTINRQKVDFKDYGCFEKRGESMIHIFRDAFKYVDLEGNKRMTFYISTHDITKPKQGKLTFGFTHHDKAVLCPDFSFDKWVDCGIEDYTAATRRIAKAGERDPSDHRLFWIGNPKTQPLRDELIALSNVHPNRMHCVAFDWEIIRDTALNSAQKKFIRLEDHCRYKYLIDCGAGGYSARLKYLLQANRPLFVVERNLNRQEFFMSRLIPFKHYIPVQSNLGDLMAKLTWADDHPNDAEKIAQTALDFAQKELNYKKAVSFLASQIQKEYNRI
ncbi:MAG: hypothetical protein ACI8ZN_001737 [Bacteroidia bacterium]|jgi:hypothetical protein